MWQELRHVQTDYLLVQVVFEFSTVLQTVFYFK